MKGERMHRPANRFLLRLRLAALQFRKRESASPVIPMTALDRIDEINASRVLREQPFADSGLKSVPNNLD
jgi:hypothetical protein